MVSWTLYALLLFSSQYIDPDGTAWPKGTSVGNGTTSKMVQGMQTRSREHNAHLVYRFFEFLFYLGWLHVAKIMLNPFGEDEDDIDVNYIIDRNLATSFLIVNGDSRDFPDQPIDTYEGSKIPTPALCYEHDETGPLPVDKILDATRVGESRR